MATARELLEQVDALMRRNRTEGANANIPVLTEAVGTDELVRVDDEVPAASCPGNAVTSPVEAGRLGSTTPSVESRPLPPDPDAVPVLTDVVTDIKAPTIQGAPDYAGEFSERSRFPSPAGTGVAAHMVAPIESRADAARWELLAEDIRMQVLQRIDIFTDTGLQEQLKARLQPIVDRASADLVATINQHVGQLLRTYVAEAIEREIEKWRQGGGLPP